MTLYHPERELGQLFIDVQLGRIFDDYKTFVDAIPSCEPAYIVDQYAHLKGSANFNLKAFIEDHFEIPGIASESSYKLEPDMRVHLHDHWPNLIRHPQKTHIRSSLIQLPHPYIVPGGRFREMFYWDSYFTIIGLLESGLDELALGMIQNFAYLIDLFGYIPNGNRSYFLGRSQPPFFACMLNAYAVKHGNKSVLPFISHLEKEYRFWMDSDHVSPPAPDSGQHSILLGNGTRLNRYFGSQDQPRAEAFGKETRWATPLSEEAKPQLFQHLRAVCESGWDFSSRWFKEPSKIHTAHAMDIAPIDLNCLMYLFENTLSSLHASQGDSKQASLFLQKAEERKTAINLYHFNSDRGYFEDYDFVRNTLTNRPTLAMVYPLYTGLASENQAKSTAEFLSNNFLHPGGLVTTLTKSGEQWDFPNGWAPLQYIAVKGLLRYGHDTLAKTISQRWLSLCERVYKDEGKLMEKYNVVDPNVKAGGGEYPNQDGFGWTNGVNLFFYRLLDE